MGMDVVDYDIRGAEMQFVEVELDPGEAAIGEAGSMMFMDTGIEMDTVFGDCSKQQGGLFGKLLGAGKRRVAFAAPYPGKILPMNLAELGGTLMCQKDAFLCAARGVSLGIAFQKRLGAGFFGGEGFIMQKLEGDGWVFVQMGGTVIERTLAPGEVLHVDTGCVAAFTPSVNFDLESVGGVKSMLFGGEGVFFARLTGPGKVWIQSLPFSRLAGRMMQAAMGRGQNRGEGSVLGELGDLIGGNR